MVPGSADAGSALVMLDVFVKSAAGIRPPRLRSPPIAQKRRANKASNDENMIPIIRTDAESKLTSSVDRGMIAIPDLWNNSGKDAETGKMRDSVRNGIEAQSK